MNGDFLKWDKYKYDEYDKHKYEEERSNKYL